MATATLLRGSIRASGRSTYEGIAADPDTISGGTWEALQRLLARAGYPDARLKREWAERIGPHLDPARNQSASFRCFWLGVQTLLAQGA